MAKPIINTKIGPPSPISQSLPSQKDAVQSIGLRSIQNGNGDFNHDAIRTPIYMAIDFIGGGRQLAASIQAASLLFHSSTGLSAAAGAAIPIGLLTTGVGSAATALLWTIPDALDNLGSANKELFCTPIANIEEVEEAKKAVEIARLGLANHSLYFSMGAAQIASGAVAMCTAPIAHVFHYTPVLMGTSATIATTVTGVALGAIYTARGAVMMARAVKSYLIVDEFHNAFKRSSQSEGDKVAQALTFMQDEEAKGATYLDRRVNPTCLRGKNVKGEEIAYTAKGIIAKDGTLKPYTSAEKQEYLVRVDKGIYTEKLKLKVSMTIAAAMIIGGVLAIVLTAVTGGIAPLIIGLVSAIFFMSMEYIFMAYDSTGIFDILRDSLYEAPDWLKEKSVKKEETGPTLIEFIFSTIFRAA